MLAAIPLIPQGIALLHFHTNGGLIWPMTWNNEVVAWTGMLSVFALISLFVAIKFKRHALATLPILTVMFALVLFFQTGSTSGTKDPDSGTNFIKQMNFCQQSIKIGSG